MKLITARNKYPSPNVWHVYRTKPDRDALVDGLIGPDGEGYMVTGDAPSIEKVGLALLAGAYWQPAPFYAHEIETCKYGFLEARTHKLEDL